MYHITIHHENNSINMNFEAYEAAYKTWCYVSAALKDSNKWVELWEGELNGIGSPNSIEAKRWCWDEGYSFCPNCGRSCPKEPGKIYDLDPRPEKCPHCGEELHGLRIL